MPTLILILSGMWDYWKKRVVHITIVIVINEWKANIYRRDRVSLHDKRSLSIDQSGRFVDEPAEPIDAMNIGHQLLEKIGWTPGHGLGLNQNGITTPVQINFRHYRQGLGYENTPMDTGERPETEPAPSLTSQTTQV